MILVKGISKSFHNNLVLKDISLEVTSGEVVVIIGPSGSGKSTFLRTLNLLEIPDKGEIYIGGKRTHFDKKSKVKKMDAEICKVRTETGMVFQNFNLFEHMTVLQNVIEGPISVRKIKKEDAIRMGREYLSKVGISEKEKNYPSELSGGQKQRVAIARALAMQPKVILFDEPTSALDPELVGEVLSVIKKLAEEGMTMIIVTHEMEFAKNIGDRIIFMDEGSIKHSGSPDEIFNKHQSKRLSQFLSSIV